MGKIKLKYEQLIKALGQLERSIINFEKIDQYPENIGIIDKEDLFLALRESMIQRFEFNVDLFWKYVKRYIEEEMKKSIEFNSPRTVIREACRIKLIPEEDSQEIMKMIDARNMTSRIYKEEVADQISSKVSDYYQLMRKYSKKLVPNKN